MKRNVILSDVITLEKIDSTQVKENSIKVFILPCIEKRILGTLGERSFLSVLRAKRQPNKNKCNNQCNKSFKNYQ